MFVLRTLLKGVRFYCNQQKRTFFRRCTCIWLTICVLLFILIIFSVTVQFSHYTHRCSDTESRLYLEQLVGSKLIFFCSVAIIWIIQYPYFNLLILLIDAFILLFMQCRNYSQGLVTGSLCSPLCDHNDIKFEKCLGHGNKLHVLKAKWRGKPVILKTSKPLGTCSFRDLSFHFSKPLNHNFNITQQEFIEAVSCNNGLNLNFLNFTDSIVCSSL